MTLARPTVPSVPSVPTVPTERSGVIAHRAADRAAAASEPGGAATSIAVCICTFRRNGPLGRALQAIERAARAVEPAVSVAVVVVDDNPDGRAREVVGAAAESSGRDLNYVHTGAGNISIARNAALESAIGLAEWIAMTDDDQTVDPGWLAALIDTQRSTGADAVTGPVVWLVPEGAPRWLREQPFAELFEAVDRPDGARMDHCLTGNSMIRSAFLRAHPSIRFPPDFGRTGGEDMVFYRRAVAAGLDARFSPAATAAHELPADRLTYRSYLWRGWWIGNSGAVSNHAIGIMSRPRLLAVGARRLVTAFVRPLRQVIGRRPMEMRFAGVAVAHAVGTIAGGVGVRVVHR